MANSNSLLQQAAAHFQAGRLVDAERSCTAALKRQPRSIEAINLAGVIALHRQNPRRAKELLVRARSLAPMNAGIAYNLGLALARLEDHQGAVAAFQTATQLNPSLAQAYNDMALSLQTLYELDAAIAAARRAVELQPGYWQALNNLGSIHEARGEYDRARECYERALSLHPESSILLTNLGNAYLGVGDLDRAKEFFREAIAVEPLHAEAHTHLLRCTRHSNPGDPDIQTADALLNSAQCDERMAIDLHFGLGKAYDDCGEYDTAFRHYESANRLVNKQQSFSADRCHGRISEFIAVYGPELIEKWRHHGNPTKQPIFIVGMPRSGTTLTEQIIASHPAVFGAGELREIGFIAAGMAKLIGSTKPYPQCMEDLTKEVLQICSDRFLSYIDHLSEGASRVTDKMPENYKRLGLIHLMFPNAKIIHCRRNPYDTCLSIYFQPFAGYHPYAYNLFNLGVQYREYERLMSWWNQLIPDSIFEVEYEELISTTEETTRKMLEFLGLDWNDACLRYNKNERRVRTASDWQVRQPIYTRSRERWRNYEAFLGPLQEGLSWSPSSDHETAR
jgi:tetratricopeptide (TPR) repeat protein